MSRTFKDRKELRSKRRKLHEPLWTKIFERLHYEGEGDNEELERCPECSTPTDLQNGFIICPECGWGNYFQLMVSEREKKILNINQHLKQNKEKGSQAYE